MSYIYRTYDEELEDTRQKARREGVTAYDFEKQRKKSVDLVKRLGFTGPKDVRRIALANGKIA